MAYLNLETLDIWFYAVVGTERVVLAQTERESLIKISLFDEAVPEIGCSIFGYSKRLPVKMGCYLSEKTDDYSFDSTVFMRDLKERVINKLERQC